MIYLSSDRHFGHAKVLEYDKERGNQFRAVEQMDEYIIRTLNQTLTPEDTLYFLGDIALCNKTRLEELLKRIEHKNKIRILGNHDTPYKNRGIEDYFIYSTDRIKFWHRDHKIHLSHYPPETINGGVHYRIKPKTIYIHGHTHMPERNGKTYDISYNGEKLLYKLDDIIDHYEKTHLPLQLGK